MHPAALLTLLVASAMALASPLAAQPHPALQTCMRWVDDGSFSGREQGKERLAKVFGDAWEEQVAVDRQRQLVAALADRAEDLQRPLASRLRAIVLLQRCALPVHFAELEDAGRERLGRVLVRCSMATEIPLGQRAEVLLAISRLHGRAERLDWLLEGQVRLRNLQRFHGAHGSDRDAGLLPAICDYFGELGQEGLPALPLLGAAMLDPELPGELRRHCVRSLGRLGAIADRDLGRSLFRQCAAVLRQAPELTDELLTAMQALAAGQDAVFADQSCREAVLGLLDHLDSLPAVAARRCIAGCSRLALHAGTELATAVFAKCGARRRELPLFADDLVSAMRALTMRDVDVFAAKAGGEAFLQLLDDFAAKDEKGERMSVLSIGVTGMIRDCAASIAANEDPELRARILARCDEVVAQMQGRPYRAMLQAAAAWKRLRRDSDR